MYKKILFTLMLVILTIGFASAADDTASDFNSTVTSPENINDGYSQAIFEKSYTHIESENITTYYMEKGELVGYLKDDDNQPIPNRTLSISIKDKIYNRTTDSFGKVVLKLNLKPNTYLTKIRFDGDENYTSSSMDLVINVKKASLAIETNDYKTYWHSDLYFKAKIINKATKNPVAGIEVIFKVYTSKNKYNIYHATTNSKGVASLKRNFKVGSYKVITSIKNDKSVKFKKTKSTLTVKPTAETGCCSFYLQVSASEAVAGFRRDATNALTIYIKTVKWNGKTAVKQYKLGNSYFFHSITTADGWMIGTGGLDNPTINRAIENIAGKIVKSGKIKAYYLNKIQSYERRLGLGHFSIKAPNGQYAVVWGSSIYTGKLKPGEYLSSPNGQSCYRYAKWTKYGSNPVKAAIKVGATDSFGVNRRDITVFHWKATTTEGKTTSLVKVYGANDNGKMVGRSTAYLKDNIYFNKKFISKNKLPASPSMLLLGVKKFGSIDKLIKIQTTVSAPKLTKLQNESKTFDITVKDEKAKNVIKNLKLKIKIGNKAYSVKTNSNGVAKFKTDFLNPGSYTAVIYSDDIRYYVSSKSTIKIS